MIEIQSMIERIRRANKDAGMPLLSSEMAEIIQLLERLTECEKALDDWYKFEQEQIKEEGPYAGKRINSLINQARAYFEKWKTTS